MAPFFKAETYAVPKRFGLGAMLAFTTLFAIALGILKQHFNAPGWVYWYAGILGVTVCLAQMYASRAPRAISVVAGALCLPLFLLVAAWEDIRSGRIDLFDCVVSTPFSLAVGGFIGYLAGALAAGVFLLGAILEARLRGSVDTSDPTANIPYYAPDSCSPYLGEAAAHLASASSEMTDSHNPGPRVKPLGPPVGVPVYNCVALIAPRNAEGLVCARAANLSDLRTTGATEREALQHLVGAFKIIVTQCLAEGREVPLLAEQHPPLPGEQQRFIAVHL